jgi:protocatechuate 3,4-dioxygenase beta subunit
MFVTKAKIAIMLMLALGLFAGAGAVAHQGMAAGEPSEESQKSEAKSQRPRPVSTTNDSRAKPADEKDSIAFSGRVLDPDGKLVAGAKLYLHMGGIHWKPSGERPTTGADGRFRFRVPRAEFGDYWTVVTAAAANHGPGWVIVPAGGNRDDLTLQVVTDDVPITGQIVDLEGKPVSEATLRVLRIDAAPGEDLSPWFEAVKSKEALASKLLKKYLTRSTIALSPTATTDAEGRFRLTGIGRNRLVTAQLDGPTIASEHLHILTRRGENVEVPKLEGKPEYGEPRIVMAYYGASFRHVAAPTKPIVGQVRDKDTKKPLAGIVIRSYKLASSPFQGVEIIHTTTNALGRYRLTGMPKGAGSKIRVLPPGDLPYVAILAEVPDKPGLDPVTVDIELKRGVWIEGKITDKVTGKPLRASVEYFAHADNPNLLDYEGLDAAPPSISTAIDDGSYRVVGLPGLGLVAVYSMSHYLRAPERDDRDGIDKDSEVSPYHIMFPSNYSALVRVNPVKGVDSVKRDVTLDPGWTFTGTVVGPDGEPLAGAMSFGLTGTTKWGMDLWDNEGTKTAAFTVRGLNPCRPRDVLFQHLEKGLIGIAQPPKETGDSITVRMQLGAVVTGRLVDAEGQLRAGVELQVSFRPKQRADWPSYSPEGIKTDREGRFRLEALVPGFQYLLYDRRGSLQFGDGLRSGETKDLGDVQMKRGGE